MNTETVTVTIFEYMINNNRFEKLIHTAAVKKSGGRTTYFLKAGKSKYRLRLKEEELDVFFNNKIFTLTENDDKCKNIMIKNYQERVEKRKKELNRDKKILKMLETR